MDEPLLRVLVDVDGQDEADARRCEREVLGHWYGDTDEVLEEAYAAYEPSTVFLALRHDEAGVVGFCRLITPGELPLKTIADIGRPPWGVDGARAAAAAGLDLHSTWDIATLGVRRELGAAGQVAAAAIYHSVIAAARANGIASILAIIDRRVRSLLAVSGYTLHPVPGTRAEPYMGSAACAPVYAHLAHLVDHQRRHLPEAHRLITLGVGLGVTLPMGESLVLRDRRRRSA